MVSGSNPDISILKTHMGNPGGALKLRAKSDTGYTQWNSLKP